MDHAPAVLARRISNLTDARYFAAKEVAWLIFNLEPGTEGYLDPLHMQAMREWVEGPGIAAEFGASTAAETIQEAARFYGLGAVVAPPSIDPAVVTAAEVWIAIDCMHPDRASWMARHREQVSGWILECRDQSGSWLPIADLLAEITAEYPVYVEYTGPVEELPALLAAVRPAGVSITGGAEEAVGVKSFDDVDAIFEILGIG